MPLHTWLFLLVLCMGEVAMASAWSLTIIATLDGFNDMDSVEVFRWQRDGPEAYG